MFVVNYVHLSVSLAGEDDLLNANFDILCMLVLSASRLCRNRVCSTVYVSNEAVFSTVFGAFL